MELQTGWIMVPLMLVGGMFYSVTRRYIYGIPLVACTVVITGINLAYYLIGFFLPSRTGLSLAVLPVLALIFIAWVIIGTVSAYRQFQAHELTIAMSLILNISLITIWNGLIYLSFFLAVR